MHSGLQHQHSSCQELREEQVLKDHLSYLFCQGSFFLLGINSIALLGFHSSMIVRECEGCYFLHTIVLFTFLVSLSFCDLHHAKEFERIVLRIIFISSVQCLFNIRHLARLHITVQLPKATCMQSPVCVTSWQPRLNIYTRCVIWAMWTWFCEDAKERTQSSPLTTNSTSASVAESTKPQTSSRKLQKKPNCILGNWKENLFLVQTKY